MSCRSSDVSISQGTIIIRACRCALHDGLIILYIDSITLRHLQKIFQLNALIDEFRNQKLSSLSTRANQGSTYYQHYAERAYRDHHLQTSASDLDLKLIQKVEAYPSHSSPSPASAKASNHLQAWILPTPSSIFQEAAPGAGGGYGRSCSTSSKYDHFKM